MGVLKTPCFSLDETYKSLQCLKWQKIFTLDGPKHLIVCGDKLCIANQYKRLGQTYTFIAGSDNDLFDTWFDFFDLSYDYSYIGRSIRRSLGVLSYGQRMLNGLHLVNIPSHQLFFESFLLSKYDRQRAAYWFEQLCAACCGVKHKKVPGALEILWTPVPTIDIVVEKYHEGELDWYMPPKLVSSLMIAVNKYITTGYIPETTKDISEKLIGKYYNMTVDQYTEWFMDGSNHDRKYIRLLSNMVYRYKLYRVESY